MRTFDPWVGSRYRTDGLSGVRLLILGESHYGDAGTESRSFTSEVVREWGQKKRLRFFTLTQKLVLGLDPGWVSLEERMEFWERVAFYNFVQCFPGPRPRYRPTEAMWKAAVKPFLATLEELDPHLLLVLGFKIYSQLPLVPSSVHICYIQHPSSAGFRCSKWHANIAASFAAIAGNVTQSETESLAVVADCSA
jgi:hypothetical protein